VTLCSVGRWQCARCWCTFGTRSLLREHQLEHRGAGGDGSAAPAMCDVCGKQFASRRLVLQHRRAHFASERRYVCHFCGIAYLHKYQLRDHMMTHLDLRTFQCEVCAETFSHPANLRHHYKRHHLAAPEEKRHKCPYCPKRFQAPASVRRHLVTHTGERPYTCSQCNKHYQHVDKLNDHNMRVHKRMPYVCPICDAGFRLMKELAMHSFQQHQVQAVDLTRSRSITLP